MARRGEEDGAASHWMDLKVREGGMPPKIRSPCDRQSRGEQEPKNPENKDDNNDDVFATSADGFDRF